MLVDLAGGWNPMLGRLAWSQIPYDNPILAPLFVVVVTAEEVRRKNTGVCAGSTSSLAAAI